MEYSTQIGNDTVYGDILRASLKYPKGASIIAAIAAVLFVVMGIVGKSHLHNTAT